MLQVDSATYSTYEASNLQNVEFFNADGSVIPSWLESGNSNTATSTTYWLHLADAIPADSSATVYMGFASPSTSFFGTGATGEAPQLSSIYGEYDNGKNVFLAYYNMNTDPVTSSLHGGTDYSVSTGTGPLGTTQSLLGWTGVAGPGGPGGSGNQLASVKANTLPSSFVITAWVETDQYPWDIGLGSTSSGSLYNGYSVDPGEGYNTGFAVWKVTGSLWDYPTIGGISYSMSPNSWYTLQYGYLQGGSITGSVEPYQNTLDVPPSATTVSASDSTYTSFDSILLAPFSDVSTYVTHWALIVARSYPPNGVMPTMSFGSIEATSTTMQLSVRYQGEVYQVDLVVPQSIYDTVATNAMTFSQNYPNVDPTTLANCYYLFNYVSKGSDLYPISSGTISESSLPIADSGVKSAILDGVLTYCYLLISIGNSPTISSLQSEGQTWAQDYQNSIFDASLGHALAVAVDLLTVIGPLTDDITGLFGATTSEQVADGVSLFFDIVQGSQTLDQDFGSTQASQITTVLGEYFPGLRIRNL